MKKLLKDKKVSIYTPKSVMDELLRPIVTWVPLTESPIWAYFRQIGGSEYYAAAVSERVVEDVLFQINWREDVTTKDRVVYRGKEYEVTRIDPFEGYKSDLKLYCKLAVQKGVL